MQDTFQAAFDAADPAGVFSLFGEYDIANSGALEEEIVARLSGGAPLMLDLTECTYIDSSVLTVLVRAVRRFGDQLQMIVPRDGNVARILSVTQLDGFFPIVT